MPTEVEKKVDGLIDDYNAYRMLRPKLRLPEVSEKNREFLIARIDKTSGGLKQPGAEAPVAGHVFFGTWANLVASHEKDFRNTTWYNCQLNFDCGSIDLTGANFINCTLANISFSKSNLTDVLFENCTFIREQMSGAIYENVKIIRPTFKNYDPVLDDLDQVTFGWRAWFFDWSKLRILSAIPLFSISWSALLGSLAIINIVGWSSSNRDKLLTVAEPLRIPQTLIEVFIGALFLAVAATLYAVFCPPRIREISETEWTDKQGKPRLQYYSKRFPYRWRERVVIVMIYIFGAIGLVLAGKLVIERVGSASCFTINWEYPERCET